MKKQALIKLVIEALQTDGAYHKQWYLEQILEMLGCDTRTIQELPWEKGIAP